MAVKESENRITEKIGEILRDKSDAGRALTARIKRACDISPQAVEEKSLAREIKRETASAVNAYLESIPRSDFAKLAGFQLIQLDAWAKVHELDCNKGQPVNLSLFLESLRKFFARMAPVLKAARNETSADQIAADEKARKAKIDRELAEHKLANERGQLKPIAEVENLFAVIRGVILEASQQVQTCPDCYEVLATTLEKADAQFNVEMKSEGHA